MATITGRQQLSEIETTCGLLLNELQVIWDEVGESEEEKDKLLLEIEQECLEVYRRKVNQANHTRAVLHQTLAEIHAQIVSFASALGDRPPVSQLENRGFTLKERLEQLKPILDEMSVKRDGRLKAMQELRYQIQTIQCEMSPSTPPMELSMVETDLTQRKLEELQLQLQILQKEKNDRLFKVVEFMDIIHDLCLVLGSDFAFIIRQVHTTLDESSASQPKSISDETISRLENTIQRLRDEKRKRMQQIKELGASLLELWNLMDTPLHEQNRFSHVTCNIAAEEDEIIVEGTLSESVIEQAETEVSRLENLKASKMKELVLKKRTELEEQCRKAHIIPETDVLDRSIASMESGLLEPADILATIEEQIVCVKEEALSRRDIMDRIEKWMAACEEENWLEEYNKDENRYSATRGAHLNLKRAERARVTVNKIPAMVDALIAKTAAWEEEMGKMFMYDGVRLLSTIEEYNILRLQKEEERRRQRDQKRLHEQFVNEQETLFGTRPSPNGRTPMKKGNIPSRMNGYGTPASRRISLGGMLLQESPAHARLNMATPGRNATPAMAVATKDNNRRATQTPVNRVLLPDEDNMPCYGISSNSKHRLILHEPEPLQNENNLPRMPLSPVSTPIRRPNGNTEAHGSPAVKAAVNMLKSPLSTAPTMATTTEDEEENVAPVKQAASQNVQQTLSVAQLPLPSSVQQPSSIQPPLSCITPLLPRPVEYSFEEKRLAVMYHYPSNVRRCR